MLLAVWLLVGAAGPATAQITSSEEERLQILTEPDAIKKKLEKEKNRAPFEFFRSQVAPFDVLPYVKANHWSTLTFELQGQRRRLRRLLQTDPVMLWDAARVYYRRDARLIKEQRARRALQIMVPDAERPGAARNSWWSWSAPGALRADASWQANLSTLPPHQMLVLILSARTRRRSSRPGTGWRRSFPASAERDGGDLEKVRYYRLVLPIEPDKPSLSSHPLTWTTISHVDLGRLSARRAVGLAAAGDARLAALGGQLFFPAGRGSRSRSCARVSWARTCRPMRPGRPCRSAEDDLQPLSQSYPPPTTPRPLDNQSEPVPRTSGGRPSGAARTRVSGAGADPAGTEAPGLPLGPASRKQGPRRFRWARRARTCWRSSAGSAADGSRC